MSERTPRVSADVLDAVLGALTRRGATTRGDLIRATGLSRPSVSGAVADLLETGVVEEVLDPPSGRGRPTARIVFNRRRPIAWGIEIGRGGIAVAGVDATGSVVASAAAPRSPAEDAVRTALALGDRLVAENGIELDHVARVAVGTPGPLAESPDGDDEARHDRRLVADRVRERFGCAVEVGNNVQYRAVAEARAREDIDDLAYLRIDEGIGGALVRDGSPFGGAFGGAGEFGHISIDPRGPRCRCGGRGCLELTASAPALLAAAGCRDLADLAARAESGEDDAVSTIARAAEATGHALAGVLSVADPGLVVVGGSVASLPGFLARTESTLRDCAPSWATRRLRITAAVTDRLLGATGAAHAALAAIDTPATDAGQHSDRKDTP